MGLEEVVGDILAAGRSQSEAMLGEARAERDRILSEAREKARLQKEARLREAVQAASQLRARELAAAELEVKRARLEMERALLDEVDARSRERVAALPRQEDEALLSAMLARSAIPGYRLYSASRNEAFLRARSSVPYAGRVECLGGFVLESPDGTVRVDLTYDTLLREVGDRMLREIYGILFSR